MKKISSSSVIKILALAFLLSVSEKYSPYSYYVLIACLLIYFIRAIIRKDVKSIKEITARDVIKYLSISAIILGFRHVILAFLGCFTMFSIQMLILLITCCILLAVYVCSSRNYSVPGKERKLFMLSVAAFVTSTVGLFIQYITYFLSQPGAEKLKLDSFDSVYILYIVLSAIYFFAARRNLANHTAAKTLDSASAIQANAD